MAFTGIPTSPYRTSSTCSAVMDGVACLRTARAPRASRTSVMTLVLAFSILAIGPTFGETDLNLRAWNADGQTWLVWDETDAPPAIFAIYRSSQPITDLRQAEKIGRMFPEDWRGARIEQVTNLLAKRGVTVPSTYSIPDQTGTGTYRLEAGEALFVYTPHSAVPEYFAVVKAGETELGAGNTTGPVEQGLDPVQCHPQFSATLNGHPLTVYAHWADGLGEFDSGRPDYPIMANEHANGVGHFFSVSDPIEGRPGGGARMPAVINLHGGTGHFVQWFPGQWGDGVTIEKTMAGGLTIAMDDCLWGRNRAGVKVDLNTQWFGYWNEFNRFLAPTSSPPADAVVHHYTLRRMEFIVEWLLANEAVDPERLSLLGHSMGGMGVSFLSRYRPDFFNCATSFGFSSIGMGGNPMNQYMRGTPEQNLPTTLGIGIFDVFNVATKLENWQDAPLTRMHLGRGEGGWSDTDLGLSIPMRMREVNEERLGLTYYWDERGHEIVQYKPGQDPWEVGVDHWVMSPRHSATYMSRYRRSQSYPAFSNDDYDPAPGRQPDPGDGDPADGDPWGVWGGGYMDWDLDTITDSTTTWAITLFLVSQSTFPNDIPDADSATTHVSVRRPQAFKPSPGVPLIWRLTRLSDQALLQTGTSAADAQGLVTVTGLTLYKDPARLEIAVNQAPTANSEQLIAREDVSLPITLSGQDPNGGSLSFEILSAPQQGTLTGTAPDLTYVPAADYHGSDSFTFRVSDGVLASDPGTIRIKVQAVNDAPIIVSGPTASPLAVRVGQQVSFAVAGDDRDGDPLTFLWDFKDGTQAEAQQPVHAFDASGVYEVAVTVSDGSASDTRTLTIRVSGELRMLSMKMQVDFQRDRSDTAVLKGELDSLDADAIPSGAEVHLEVGSASVRFLLDERLRFRDAKVGSIRFKYRKRTAIWTFRCKLNRGDYQSSWAASGMTSAVAQSQSIRIPVTLQIGDLIHSVEVPLQYKSNGRKGKARMAK